MSSPTHRPDPFAQPPGGSGAQHDDAAAWGSADVPGVVPGDESGAERPERAGTGSVVVRVLLALVLGAAVAALGAATHRSFSMGLPLGFVIALALTASTALLCRAWAGMATLAAAAVGWLVLAQLLSLPGRGGDVIITDPTAPGLPWAWLGLAWSYAGIVVFGIVAFLPRRWFARR